VCKEHEKAKTSDFSNYCDGEEKLIFTNGICSCIGFASEFSYASRQFYLFFSAKILDFFLSLLLFHSLFSPSGCIVAKFFLAKRFDFFLFYT
jgi:hypothetical protein